VRRHWFRLVLRPFLRTSWSAHEAAAQEIEARSAKHLALQHFQAIDMALDRSIGPRQCDAGFDRLIVRRQPSGEALHSLQGTAGGALQPRIELRRLALADEGGKVLREVDRLGDLGRLGVELGELLSLLCSPLRLTLQD
jgi:hypothetical protein